MRSDGKVSDCFSYRGEDCVQEFLKALLSTERVLRQQLIKKAKINITDEAWKAYHRATDCHICHKSLYKYNEKDEIEFWHPETGEYYRNVHRFTRAPGSKSSCYSEVLRFATHDESDKYIYKPKHPRVQESKEKAIAEGLNEDDCFYCNQPQFRDKFREGVRDHCHITGKFRGAAHIACNLSYFRINPRKTIIPVVFHNLRGYDAHHLMQDIAAFGADQCNASQCNASMHPKQHGEVHRLLTWKPQVHRQFLIPLIKPRQPCFIQQAGGLQDHEGIRKRR